ncbi:hypothetical protein [Nocardia coubleae]|uniref:Uncharacterized protein n=1 Tax=Nocardia coubleae TaxID=356147 RepID=A0A846W5M5_9NOCA|nr:hypothetical protein [Nocardia coubleae]NKX88153.1 hypothetical protein [Nocardia coubleae]
MIPLIGYARTDGAEGLVRFQADDVADAAQMGAAQLQEGRPEWAYAALVVDAFLRLPNGRTDALVIEAIDYGPQRRSIKMAVPYRPHASELGFAVYRPKFVGTSGFEEPDYDAIADAFFAGVDSHEQAAAVWNAHLVDESV